MAIDPVQLKLNGMPGDEGMSRRRHLKTQGDESFGDMLKDAVNSVDAASKDADQKVEDLVAGRTDNVHEVTIAMQKAQLSFELMTQIRNKVVETYRELSRMPI
jgi:flagellar hook-basal body complex protein FliE